NYSTFIFTAPATTHIYTLSLHDALPISNDYVGKGLCGATISLRPTTSAAFPAHTNTIIGNTVLYGATSGKLFAAGQAGERFAVRSEEHTSELQSLAYLVCRLLLEKKKKK